MSGYLTVRRLGLAALLSGVSLCAYAQPVSDMPVPPAPLPTDAAIISPPPAERVPLPSDVQIAPPPAPAPIPADIALPQVQVPASVSDAALPNDATPVVEIVAPPMAGMLPDAGIEPTPPDASAPDATVAVDTGTPPNFDDFGSSLFYKSKDIGKLKAALDIADALARKAAQGASKIEEAIIPAPEPPKIEITQYPVFHLSSIMYQGAGKWVMWVNGIRTTSKNLPVDLSVAGINTQQVSFEWKPQILPALQSHWKSEEGDASRTNLKKLLSSPNMVALDDRAGVVRFTLRPNQTYSSAYNAVMEGKQLPVMVSGDNGILNVGAFEQTLRENADRNQAAASANPRQPRIIRPGQSQSAQSGDPATGAVVQPPVRRSGLVSPDSAKIGLVPSIFPGGVPATAQPAQQQPPQPAPDPGLPVLPAGAQ